MLYDQGRTMPRIRQGDIHDYDFGPVIGAELSGRRPALIISANEFNGSYRTAIALPMSTTMPAERYRTRQHVHVADTDSWASTRQVKAVQQRRLGAIMGRASPDELDDAIESLARRFTTRHRPGEAATPEGMLPIDAGSLWRLPVTGSGGAVFLTTVLVVDYNAGNNLAIMVEVEEREARHGAPGDVPITVLDSNVAATALVQRVRTIDAGERNLTAAGLAHSEGVGAVISRLLSVIQRPEA
jgi:mRNA interferase MazF